MVGVWDFRRQFSTMDIWGPGKSVPWGDLCTVGCLAASQGLYSLDGSSSSPSPIVKTKICPDIVKCHLGDKHAPPLP